MVCPKDHMDPLSSPGDLSSLSPCASIELAWAAAIETQS